MQTLKKIKNWLPSILKHIGTILFLFFIFSFIRLVITIFDLSLWYSLVSSVPLRCLFTFLMPDLLEFVCARSPYIMRGLLLGYAVFMCTIAVAVNPLLGRRKRYGTGSPTSRPKSSHLRNACM